MGKQNLALIWISVGNSYFKEKVIKKTLISIGKKFEKVIIMAPDIPAEHTYRAMGYKENEVKRKAKLNANLFQNRSRRVIKDFDKSAQKRYNVIEWEDEVKTNKAFLKQYELIKKLYKNNALFRKDANEVTKEVIGNKLKEGVLLKDAIEESVHYLLKEIAFVLASLEIYNAESVTYVYHKEWKFFLNFIEGKYDGVKRNKVKFLLHRVV